MTMQTPPPSTPLIPESAPFSPEQRAWLNGFCWPLVARRGIARASAVPLQTVLVHR
jgi:sulfite reductase (NADPH) flavoprotein alpha-component